MQAIQSALKGVPYLCPEATATMVAASRGNRGAQGTAARVNLGRREVEVLRLIAEGKSSPQIGQQLHIAPSTVDVHRRNIMKKLDLHSVVDLTKYAILMGLTRL
jgi:two-component system NarL family response regulator